MPPHFFRFLRLTSHKPRFEATAWPNNAAQQSVDERGMVTQALWRPTEHRLGIKVCARRTPTTAELDEKTCRPVSNTPVVCRRRRRR